jgi:hypothetical protein
MLRNFLVLMVTAWIGLKVFSIVLSGVGIISAILAVIVVINFTSAQHSRSRRLGLR